MPANSVRLQPAPREALREARVVEVALPAQPLDRRVDLLGGVPALAERLHELRLRVVPPREAPERARVGRRLGLGDRLLSHSRPRRPAVRRGSAAQLSRSNDCIVFSISSAAMSEVDWMPWILSLNSSGLLARRSASS